MNKHLFILVATSSILFACDPRVQNSDELQKQQQEKILAEGTATIGMPAIHNFRERKLLKTILELRDQENLNTFTYIWSDMKGQYSFFCNSIGYGIPYATQFTNPEKVEFYSTTQTYGSYVMPQADPNGLFSPVSAEGTWVMCNDPKKNEVRPVYVEPRIMVSPFELPENAPGTKTDKK